MSAYRKLPSEISELARKNYQIWKNDPFHPSLHFKRVSQGLPAYSVRVGMSWRALAIVEGDLATWFWIGSHAEYDRIVRTF